MQEEKKSYTTRSEIDKRVYDYEYKKMKEKGYPFHPFATWKDTVVALVVLCILLGSTAVWGVHFDAPADPTAQFLPRPEWYFMFLFELLKYFPGILAIFPVAIIPGVGAAVLVLLPFFDRNPYRSWKRRPVAITLMTLTMLSLVGLTELAYYQDAQNPTDVTLAKAADDAAKASEEEPMFAGPNGQVIFSAKCVTCHGATGTNIPGVKLFDKSFLTGRDLVAIVTNGTPKGMPAWKGQLGPEEIAAVTDYLKATAK